MNSWTIAGVLVVSRIGLLGPPRLIDGLLSLVVAALLYLFIQGRR